MAIITECSFIFNRKYFFQRHKYPVFFIRRAYILCRIFHVLRSVLHSIAIAAVIQHFYIISSISEGSALLRRNPPAFCKSFKAGSLMTSRYDQVNRAVAAGCRLYFPFEPFTEDIVVKIRFFFWNCGSKFQDLVCYFFEIIYPLQPMIVDTGKIKKFLAHVFPLAVCAVYAAQYILHFRIFPAHINDKIHSFLWHVRSKNQFFPIFYKGPVFRYK